MRSGAQSPSVPLVTPLFLLLDRNIDKERIKWKLSVNFEHDLQLFFPYETNTNKNVDNFKLKINWFKKIMIKSYYDSNGSWC